MWWDAVAGVLVDRLCSLLQSKACQFYEFDDQFKELKDELCYVQSFLEDANNVKPKQQIKTLKTVMADLRELVYEAEEIIDDYELQFHEVGDRKIRKLLAGSSASSLNPFNQMGMRLEKIIRGMKKAKERMAGYLVPVLGMRSHNQGNVRQPLSYPLLLDEDEIVGLDIHSARIKQWILDRNEPLTVIGIVGMGGIGKTTLAQKIYHDSEDYFRIRLFVAVSQNFKFEELIKTILVKLNVEEASLRGDARNLLETLQCKLDREFLLVLDDVWGADEGLWWESLKSSLPKGHHGCVIVTTRKEDVAKSMGAVEERIHRLNLLSDDESWSLFSKVAFQRYGGDSPNSPLKDIGRKIVSKCGRLPLAIKIIGGMMVTKGDSIHKWRETLEQLEQGSASIRKDGLLMNTLELSYEDLPAHLKPCVLCFAMHPKDYVCGMLEMVYWWIGEGFVRERDGRTALEIGEEYYIELLSRCLVIGEAKDNFGEKFISCKMHDIVHEVIKKIAIEENFVNRRYGSRKMPIDLGAICRRFSTGGEIPEADAFVNLRALAAAEVDGHVLLCLLKASRLRVLDVSLDMTAFHRRYWVEGIGTLHHLSYMRLEFPICRQLPDSFAGLRNLKVLVIKSCWLETLPHSITTLEKLIILQVDAPLESMPHGLGKLSNLEKMWGYRTPDGRLEENSCWSVELKKLTKLRMLDILIDEEMEEGAWKVLAALPQLKVLQVRFEDNEKVLQVDHLQQLHPLRHLEELHILHYPRDSVPAWLHPAAFPNLRRLTFEIGWSYFGTQDRDVSVSEYPSDPQQERLLSLVTNKLPYARICLVMTPRRKPLHYFPTH